jgi:hypothetical protein
MLMAMLEFQLQLLKRIEITPLVSLSDIDNYPMFSRGIKLRELRLGSRTLVASFTITLPVITHNIDIL